MMLKVGKRCSTLNERIKKVQWPIIAALKSRAGDGNRSLEPCRHDERVQEWKTGFQCSPLVGIITRQ
jgi:hypothetical protein